jgi:hypothetical protein
MEAKMLRIDVTATDIACGRNPVCEAVERAVGKAGGEMYHANIRGDRVIARWAPGKSGDFVATLPQEALDFVEAWSAGYHVSPFAFSVTPTTA